MSNLRIQSVRSPFDDPELASSAIAVLSRADAMGLLPRLIQCLDDSAIRDLVSSMSDAGIAKSLLLDLQQSLYSDPAVLSPVLDRVSDALEHSPVPEYEWQSLKNVLGLKLLTRLLRISESSAQRYLAGTRRTPDTVVARLHFLAFVVGDLAGAYNDIGVRRWFERRRKRLDGKTPAEMLTDGWSPDDENSVRVRDLSRSIVSLSAT